MTDRRGRSVRDVIIIGGGISGAAAAYELARAGAPSLFSRRAISPAWRPAGRSPGSGSPAATPRSCRSRWPPCAAGRGWPTSSVTEVEYRQEGNLRLARTPEEIPIVSELVRSQRALGLDLALLPDTAAVAAVAPALADTVLAASYCPSDGHANPNSRGPGLRRRGRAARRRDPRRRSRSRASTRQEGVCTASRRRRARSRPTPSSSRPASTPATLCEPIGLDAAADRAARDDRADGPAASLVRQVLGVANADFAGRQEVSGRFRMSGDAAPWRWPSDAD